MRPKLLGASLLLLFLAALTLASCQQRGADDYSFEKREWTHHDVRVVVVEHENLADLRAAAPPSAKQDGRDLMAWSSITPTTCTIHVLKPEMTYAPEWIGHEFAHCAWGRWHS